MQSSLTYRTNRDLFSNYYLDEHLPETEGWDEVSDDDLDAKIEKTDRLIDEVVYDLYDLTDEEIEIVESAVADD